MKDSHTNINAEKIHQSASYRGGNFSYVHFVEHQFKEVDFIHCILQYCDYTESNLQQCKFYASKLRCSIFTRSKFENCSFKLADLESANLEFVKASNCDFSDATLYNATFKGADLRGVDFTNSDLRNANLQDADLRGAILHNTDFANADLTGALLDDVRCNRMRITNTKGLKDITKDQLLAGGAYEGLPPSITTAQMFMNEIGGKLKQRWNKIIQSTTTANDIENEKAEENNKKETQTFHEMIFEQFEEYKKQYIQWKQEQREERKRLQQEDDEWQLNRERERIRIVHERQVRDQQRKIEKEKREKEQKILDTISKKSKNIKKLHKKNLQEIEKCSKKRNRAYKKYIKFHKNDILEDVRTSIQKQESDIALTIKNIELLYLSLLQSFESIQHSEFSIENQREQDKILQQYKGAVEKYIVQEQTLEDFIIDQDQQLSPKIPANDKQKASQSNQDFKNIRTEKHSINAQHISENFSIQQKLQDELNTLYTEMEQVQTLLAQMPPQKEETQEREKEQRSLIKTQPQSIVTVQDTELTSDISNDTTTDDTERLNITSDNNQTDDKNQTDDNIEEIIQLDTILNKYQNLKITHLEEEIQDIIRNNSYSQLLKEISTKEKNNSISNFEDKNIAKSNLFKNTPYNQTDDKNQKNDKNQTDDNNEQMIVEELAKKQESFIKTQLQSIITVQDTELISDISNDTTTDDTERLNITSDNKQTDDNNEQMIVEELAKKQILLIESQIQSIIKVQAYQEILQKTSSRTETTRNKKNISEQKSSLVQTYMMQVITKFKDFQTNIFQRNSIKSSKKSDSLQIEIQTEIDSISNQINEIEYLMLEELSEENRSTSDMKESDISQEDKEKELYILNQVLLEQRKLQNYTFLKDLQNRKTKFLTEQDKIEQDKIETIVGQIDKDADKISESVSTKYQTKLQKQNNYIQKLRTIVNQSIDEQLHKEEERLQRLELQDESSPIAQTTPENFQEMMTIAEKVYENLQRSSQIKEESDKQAQLIAQKLRLQRNLIEEAEYKLREQDFISRELWKQETEKHNVEHKSSDEEVLDETKQSNFFLKLISGLQASKEIDEEQVIQNKILMQEEQRIQEAKRIEDLKKQLQQLQMESIQREEAQKKLDQRSKKVREQALFILEQLQNYMSIINRPFQSNEATREDQDVFSFDETHIILQDDTVQNTLDLHQNIEQQIQLEEREKRNKEEREKQLFQQQTEEEKQQRKILYEERRKQKQLLLEQERTQKREQEKIERLQRTLEQKIEEENQRKIREQQLRMEESEKKELQRIQQSLSIEQELQSAQVQVYFEESLLEYNRRERADTISKKLAQQIREEILFERRKLEQDRELIRQEEQQEQRKVARSKRELKRVEDYTQIRSELSRQINEERYQVQQEDIILELQREKEYALQRIKELTQINRDGFAQQSWYKFTDYVSQTSPNLASHLDKYKENIEDYIISKRVFAYRERERQVRERLISIERARVEQQNLRLQNITSLYEREQIRAEKADRRDAELQRLQNFEKRRNMLRELEDAERHSYHRTEIERIQIFDLIVKSDQELYGDSFEEHFLYRSRFERSKLSGISFANASLIEANFTQTLCLACSFIGTTMDYVHFNNAQITGGSLHGSDIVHASFRLARITDIHIKNCNFSSSELYGIDFTGTIITNSQFDNCNLEKSVFSNATLQHISFLGANLQNARFEKVHLEHVNFIGADVTGMIFSYCSGLDLENARMLESRGARILSPESQVTTNSISRLRIAITLFAFAFGTYIFSNYVNNQEIDITALEAEALQLTQTDPEIAAERYTYLAQQSLNTENRVHYLIEASSLYEQVRQMNKAQEVLEQALVVADQNKELKRQVLFQLVELSSTQREAKQTLEYIEELSALTLTAQQRAKSILYLESIVLIEENSSSLPSNSSEEGIVSEQPEIVDGEIVDGEIEPSIEQEKADLIQKFSISTGAINEADFRIALAELRVNNEDPIQALAELQKVEIDKVDTAMQIRLIEVKARVQERGGDTLGALETLNTITDLVASNTLSWQTAQLSIADIHQREGRIKESQQALTPLLLEKNDDRVRGRALLIQGKLLEEEEKFQSALENYRLLLELKDVEPETKEESRVSLARILLEMGMEDEAIDITTLPKSAILQARLGEARRHLDKGNAEKASTIYQSIITSKPADEAVDRAARSGFAETLSAMGEYTEAERYWRELLAEDIPEIERGHINVLLAYGLLQSGNHERAKVSFEALLRSSNPEFQMQGKLGLAETIRTMGERERAKEYFEDVLTQSEDRAYQIQALRELTQINLEQGKPMESLRYYKQIQRLGGKEYIMETQLGIFQIYQSLEDTENIDLFCNQAELHLQSKLNCGHHYAKNPEQKRKSEQFFVEILEHPISDEEQNIKIEAAIGHSQLTNTINYIDQILEDDAIGSKIESTNRLFLLTEKLRLDTSLSAEQRNAYQQERLLLGRSNPTLVAQTALETATQHRMQGNYEKAIETYEQTLSLELSADYKTMLSIELSDLYIERSDFEVAKNIFVQYDVPKTFEVQIQIAHILHLDGQLEASEQLLNTIQANTEEQEARKSQIRAQILTDKGDPSASEEWQKVSENSSDKSIRYHALYNKAQLFITEHNWSKAQAHLEEAQKLGNEEYQQEWIEMSLLQVYVGQSLDDAPNISFSELQNIPKIQNQYTKLVESSNFEIQTQAVLTLATIALEMEVPAESTLLLKDWNAFTLGPGWDTSVTELHASALIQDGKEMESIELYQNLIDRWDISKNPSIMDEVWVPSWIGLSSIYESMQEYDKAKEFAQKAQKSSDDHFKKVANEILERLP